MTVIDASERISRSRDDLVIKVDRLNHYFGDGSTRKQALFDCSLVIGPGELVIMTGPSGSGKTTLLTLIGALRATEEGSVRVLGRELFGLPPEELVLVRRSIGFIFQLHNLFDSLSAYENVRMSMDLRSYSATETKLMATEVLTKLGLDQRMNYKPHQMSGGQRQRVAIARALVNRPKLILADEPTAALDKKSSRDVVDLLHALTRQDGATILMVTHDSRILDVADRIVNMVDGHIESDVIVNESIRICEALKHAPLFQQLTPSQLLSIAQKMHEEVHRAGQMVFRQGDVGENFYIIATGGVSVIMENGHREPEVIRKLGAGDFFGERALITGERRSASILATTDSTLYRLASDDFHAAIAASDSFQQQLRKIAFQC